MKESSIVQTQSVPGYETFVWNDKLVLTSDDDLDKYYIIVNGFDLYFSLHRPRLDMSGLVNQSKIKIKISRSSK